MHAGGPYAALPTHEYLVLVDFPNHQTRNPWGIPTNRPFRNSGRVSEVKRPEAGCRGKPTAPCERMAPRKFATKNPFAIRLLRRHVIRRDGFMNYGGFASRSTGALSWGYAAFVDVKAVQPLVTSLRRPSLDRVGVTGIHEKQRY